MSNARRDAFFAIIVMLFLSLYGLWIIKKAIQQIRNPTSLYDLGIGWWLDMFLMFSGNSAHELEEHFSQPEIVRFYAGLALLAGFFIAFGPLVIWFILFVMGD